MAYYTAGLIGQYVRDASGTFDLSGGNLTITGTLSAGSAAIPTLTPSNLTVPGYIRNALTPTTLDISGGNISNSGTTSSSNFVGTSSASNSIGGVTLSNSNAIVGGFLRNALTPTTLDISGGNISNSGTTRSSNVRVTSAGTASAPALVIGNDASSGFYSTTNSLFTTFAGIQTTYFTNNFIEFRNNGSQALWILDRQLQGASTSLGAVAPTYSFALDTALGLYRVRSNTLGIASGGQNVMTIHSNVGIGTTFPSYTLDVSGTTQSSNILVPGYIRDALTPTTLDISGGNISNSGTTLSSTFTTLNAFTSNTIGGVILANSNISNTGRIFTGAGTVNAPSYSFATDASLGLYDPATNVLGIATAGVERMRVDQSGNVGIGTTAPSNTLDVSGTMRVIPNATALFDVTTGASGYATVSTNGYFGIYAPGTTNKAASNLTVSLASDSGGNHLFLRSTKVGIGTAAPATALDVSAVNQVLALSSSATTSPTPIATTYQPNLTTTSPSNYTYRFFGVNSNSSNAVGEIFTYVGSGNASNSYRIYIQGQASGGITLLANGNVGIGKTAPAAFLDIGNSGTNGGLQIYGLSNNNIARPAIDSSSGYPTVTPAYEIRAGSASGADGFLRIRAGGLGFNSANAASYIDLTGFSSVPDMLNNIVLGTGGAERMRITNTGNVGIGTTAPLYRLDINGPSTTDVRIASGGVTPGAGGQLNFGIANGIGATNPMAAIKGLLVNFPTIGGTAEEQGSLGFYTRASNASVSQSLVERMRITHDGSVGIGTAAPTVPLDVSSGVVDGIIVRRSGGAVALTVSNQASVVSFGMTSAQGDFFADSGIGDAIVRQNSATSRILLGTGTAGGTTSTLCISNQRVGIGMASPNYRLDVSSQASSNASINMSTWPRSAISWSHVVRGTISNAFNGGGSISTYSLVFNTPSVALDTNLGTVTNDTQYGTYFVCLRSGIWQLGFTVSAANELSALAIDTSTNFQDNADPNTTAVLNRSLGFLITGYFVGSVHYTGYLPSNAGRYYKFKCNANNLTNNRERALLQITFLGEQPTAAGSWPL